MVSHIWPRVRGSRPVVGSSRKISGGRVIRLAARSSRRRMPPENCEIGRSAASSSPKLPSSSSAVARRGATARPWSRPKSQRFSRAVRFSSTEAYCPVTPTSWRISCGRGCDVDAEDLGVGRRRWAAGWRASGAWWSCRRRWGRGRRRPRRGGPRGRCRRRREVAEGLDQAGGPDREVARGGRGGRAVEGGGLVHGATVLARGFTMLSPRFHGPVRHPDGRGRRKRRTTGRRLLTVRRARCSRLPPPHRNRLDRHGNSSYARPRGPRPPRLPRHRRPRRRDAHLRARRRPRLRRLRQPARGAAVLPQRRRAGLRPGRPRQRRRRHRLRDQPCSLLLRHHPAVGAAAAGSARRAHPRGVPREPHHQPDRRDRRRGGRAPGLGHAPDRSPGAVPALDGPSLGPALRAVDHPAGRRRVPGARAAVRHPLPRRPWPPRSSAGSATAPPPAERGRCGSSGRPRPSRSRGARWPSSGRSRPCSGRRPSGPGGR